MDSLRNVTIQQPVRPRIQRHTLTDLKTNTGERKEPTGQTNKPFKKPELPEFKKCRRQLFFIKRSLYNMCLVQTALVTTNTYVQPVLLLEISVPE